MSKLLKSTYRVAAPAAEDAALPAGWTEHKAPTGHTYYYNTETKQSTYTRPVAEPEELQIDYNATGPDVVVQASFKVLDEFHKQNPDSQRGQGQFTGGKGYQDRSRRGKHQDRPKSKKNIENCEPWILVTTKFKRRFVHNSETKESLWKFPSDVMMAVIEMEKKEWQAKQDTNAAIAPQSVTQADQPKKNSTKESVLAEDLEDDDSYEEVEVTDEEDGGEDGTSPKRQRMKDVDEAPKGPIEFDEDDMAWQLAQMDEGYGDDQYDKEYADEQEDEGLPMTAEDSIALFRSLLDNMRISPFSPFDVLLEKSNAPMLEDDRWVALPTMSSRRSAFSSWSRDRMREIKSQQAAAAVATKKRDPRTEYLGFLQEHATPKLYWPEFKRKFRKEPIMKDLNLSDKDREKIYREFIPKIKLSESERKKEFVALLKSLSTSDDWNRQTTLDNLPDVLLKDLRFYVIGDGKTQGDLLEAHIATLREQSLPDGG